MCDNVGDHLIGNVYARFDWEDEAQRAVEELNKRWYAGMSTVPSDSAASDSAVCLALVQSADIPPSPAGRPLYAELSPVTDFREACCRQNDLGQCDRGGFCK